MLTRALYFHESLFFLPSVDPFFVHIDEMEMKIPKFMKIFWRSTWQVITPLIIGIVLITGYAAAREDKYLGYTYPDSAQVSVFYS